MFAFSIDFTLLSFQIFFWKNSLNILSTVSYFHHLNSFLSNALPKESANGLTTASVQPIQTHYSELLVIIFTVTYKYIKFLSALAISDPSGTSHSNFSRAPDYSASHTQH